MNDSGQLNWNENRLIFYTNVPKLQTLASSRFAVMVWRNEIIDRSLKINLPSSSRLVDKFNLENVSSIPTRLRDLIAKRIRRIGKELENWFRNPYEGVIYDMFAKDDDTWVKYFDDLVWNIDYSVDYQKTCQNLMQSDRLSAQEKFPMACSYCLENFIEELWTQVHKTVDGVDGPRFESSCSWLLHYWIDRMKNRSARRNISDTLDEDDTMLIRPLNRWAIEYFRPYLSFDRQVSDILSIIFTKDHICIKDLLPKLSESHLLRILSEKGSDIMEILIENVKCRPMTVPFWNHVKHMFDDHQFFELVKWMLVSEVGGSYCHLLCENEVLLCQQIWTSAPDRLKEYTLNFLSADNSSFMGARLAPGESYRSVSLLKMVLLEASPEQRSVMWKENWLKFCKHTKSSDTNELLELCLPDIDERIEFKRQIMMKLDNTDNYCFSLLDTMQFAKLDEFLKICSTDLEASVHLKQRLMRSYFLGRYGGFSNDYFRRLDDFMAFVDESFSNPERSGRFKKEIITHRGYLDRLVERLYDGEFATIKKLVTMCLSSEQDVIEWKEEFRHYCHHSLMTGLLREFDPCQWQDFMMWCLGSEEKVFEFKQSLDADEIFVVFLERCDGSKRVARQLNKIFDDFLKWRFVSEQDIVKFKQRYTRANPNDDEIHGLLFGSKRKH